jgi:peptide chain release factor subunit 1
VTSLLDEIRPLAKDGTGGRESRLSLRGDIARIKDTPGKQQRRPGAVAIFACGARGLHAEVPLPRPVPDLVLVGATPLARPILAALEDGYLCRVTLADRSIAPMWQLDQDEVRELGTVRDPDLRKPNYAAGLAEDRLRNMAEELAKRHYRHVAEQLGHLRHAGAYDVLVIGGRDYEGDRC